MPFTRGCSFLWVTLTPPKALRSINNKNNNSNQTTYCDSTRFSENTFVMLCIPVSTLLHIYWAD